MAGAIAMRVRPARDARRVLAVAAAVWLVAFGVLGARHEARVAHVVDQSGAIVHASATACHDHISQTHVHGATTADDHDVCGLLSVLHQAAAPAVAATTVAHAFARTDLVATILDSHVASSGEVYRLAPKTSPPRAV